jgi:hypothetical protein
MRTVTLCFPLLCVAVAAVGVACSSRGGQGFGDPDAAQDDGGPVVTDDSGDLLSGDGAGEAGCVTCGPDLRTIVTCGDNVPIGTCAGDNGCAGGTCIPACDAAGLSKSTIGCDYYSVPPDAWTIGSCFAAFVTNTWSTPMKVSLVWKGQMIDGTKYAYVPKGQGASITYQAVPSTGIPANTMAIVFLNDSKMNATYYVGCPMGVSAAVSGQQMVVPGTRIADAIEIKTSVPAVVYDIYPYGGALSYMPSATLLVPTTAWDTNYVTTTMSEEPANTKGGIDLIAFQNNTKITVLPSTNIVAGTGVAAATKNTPITYTINQGQVVHITQPSSATDNLSGSVIQSNNPVGVWGEHNCMTHSASPPKWRIVGAVNGTNLTYDPPVAMAPATLELGQMVEFVGPEAFDVKSQDDKHPFYLAAYRPGGDCDAAHQQIPSVQALGSEYVAVGNETTNFGIGGPETVNVIPPAQFLTSYIFFTDPTYGNTDLTLTRVKDKGVFKDVTLDCLGKVTGWKPIGSTPYEYTHVDVQKNKMPVGACDNGLHTIKSDAPVGITVWGYDSAASYAYPAGASVKAINTVVIPPTPN